MKIVQICTLAVGASYDIYGLSDDGELYLFVMGRERFAIFPGRITPQPFAMGGGKWCNLSDGYPHPDLPNGLPDGAVEVK